MESDQLCPNLLKWLATFDAGAKVTKPSDISDGVVIANVLHAIEPLWFDASWLGKIKTDVGGNWVFKISNLKKVTQGISDCFSDSLELNISHLPKPDVNKLGEDNPEEAGRLLQLVLGVAVNCTRKHEYIEAIQRLELSVQAVLMAAIQELMRGGGAESMKDVDRLRGVVRDYDVMKDERKQRCFELNNQIALLHDENAALQAENQQLQKRLNEQRELPQPVSPVAEGPDQSQRYKQLRGKLAAADDEIYKLEAVREEFRIKCEVMEKDLRETQAKNEELQRMADETRCLRDELDILRDTSSKVTQWETALDTYKKRLQEMGDLRRQIKLLEDKNTDYMQHNMELEEELKKSGSYRPQLDLYKKQVGELHEQLAEEVKKRDKAEFDLRKLTEKMTALQSEKERLTAERDKLREVNEELKLAQLQLSGAPPPLGARPGNGCSSSSELDTIEQIPTDVKEKLLRLQYENRQLRSQVSAGGQQQPDEACRALRDDLRRDTNLQAENRRLNQRILELQSRLEETEDAAGRGPTHSAGRLYSLEQELNSKNMQIGAMEIRLAEQDERTREQQEQLSRRDAEMAAMEERYKKYLEKAKSVIRSLDPKTAGGQAGSPDMSVLRHQLAEKERLLEVMEKENEKAKSIREAEERLITTAFYNFGSQIHRQAMEQRLSNISGGQSSFMARQRQANTRRLHGNSEFYDY